jgi:PAS domain S-box-containing protein
MDLSKRAPDDLSMGNPSHLPDMRADQLFENAFHFAAIGIALVARDGRWLRVNHSVCELVGYSEAELLQMRFQDLTHQDDLEQDLENVARLLRGEVQSYQMEKRYLHKAGNVIWAVLSVSLVRGRHGEPLFFISQIQDITERRAQEEKLAAADAEIRRLRKELLKVLSLIHI